MVKCIVLVSLFGCFGSASLSVADSPALQDKVVVQGSGMGEVVISVTGSTGGVAEELVTILDHGGAKKEKSDWQTADGKNTATNYTLEPMAANSRIVGNKPAVFQFVIQTVAKDTAWGMFNTTKGNFLKFDAKSSRLLFLAMKSSGIGTVIRKVNPNKVTTNINTEIDGKWIACNAFVFSNKSTPVTQNDIDQAESGANGDKFGNWSCTVIY